MTQAELLHGNLLRERLLHYRTVAAGDTVAANLPELFAAMNRDEVRDFPALRPHQRHPWHAFLVQLAAIALHQAERDEPFETAVEWDTALMALTPDDPDGAAWCLVSPPQRPAFMQAPVLVFDFNESWKCLLAPDELDVIKTSKNHDLKSQRMVGAREDDWVFSLISLQTQSPSDSGSYKESSRMNGGWGRRLGVGVVPVGGYGARWARDVRILLESRLKICEDFGFCNDGLKLIWLVPWDSLMESCLNPSKLNPFYLEVTRRVRLVFMSGEVQCRSATTPNPRVGKIQGGLTGDIWSPIETGKDGERVVTIRSGGISYAIAVKMIIPGQLRFSPAMKIKLNDGECGLRILMQSIAWGEKNTNSGYHERSINVGGRMAAILRSGKVDQLARIASHRVQIIHEITSKALWPALLVLFSRAKKKDSGEIDAAKSIENITSRYAKYFEKICDTSFFEDLSGQIESEHPNKVWDAWLVTLSIRAEEVLCSAFLAGPRSAQLRYRAQSEAIAKLRSTLRSPKFPDLAAALKSRQSDMTEENHEPA